VIVGALVDRANEEIADQADEKKTGHEIHRGSVEADSAGPALFQMYAEVVDQHGTENSRRGPGGEKPAMDRAHLHRSKKILEISGDGGETAAIHAQDHGANRDEQKRAAGMGGEGNECVENRAEQEEMMVDVLASDEIAERRPAEPARHVEEAEQGDESAGGCGVDAVLSARRERVPESSVRLARECRCLR